MSRLFTAKSKSKKSSKGKEEEENPSVLYLRSALRLLARESKQRERLAFLATSSVALPGDEAAMDEDAMITRKLAGRLSQVDSVRARARRRRAQVGRTRA